MGESSVPHTQCGAGTLLPWIAIQGKSEASQEFQSARDPLPLFRWCCTKINLGLVEQARQLVGDSVKTN
jgi:hypothetical protein